MRRLAPVLAAVTGLALGAGSGAAQCTGTPLSISGATPGSIVFPLLTGDDFEAGSVTYAGTLSVTVTPSTVHKFTLCARAGTQDMGLSDDGTYTKVIGDIRVKSTGATSYISLTQSDQPIVSNLKKPQTVTLNVQVRLTWADLQGNYASSIVLTAY